MSSLVDDIWGGAKGVLGFVAPLLATAVGGPLAGTAVRAICGALGLDPNTPTEQVALAVQNATPDQLAALKTAEFQFQEQMKQLDIDAEKLGYDDRANARAREIAVKDKTPMALAVAVTVGFFSLLGVMAFVNIPIGNEAVLNIMIGALGAGWTTMLAYYFGSSSGSRDKDATIASQAEVVNTTSKSSLVSAIRKSLT
jgi:hypothetical protein